jgi:hypothetical protein
MAAYYKVDVSLSTNSVTVGMPSPQEVLVTLPLVGPQGAAGATGATGATGPAGSGIEILTTQGDLLYRGASEGERLPIGTSGQVLKVSGGIPAWGAESGAVSSVAGRTGAVTLAVADVANAVATSDSRLSDARTPLSHTHGNLTNDGKVGTIANLPLRTGTNGVVEAGSFGTSAGSFCEGNDSRLSDTRTPSSTLAHASSHATGGTDALTPFSIGADSRFVTTSLTVFASQTLAAGRAQIYILNVVSAATVTLPTTGVEIGDRLVIVGGSPVSATATLSSTGISDELTSQNQQFSYVYGNVGGAIRWLKNLVDTHTHAAADITGLPAASTTTPAALGTAAVGTGTTFARADHVHAMPTAANVGAAQAVMDIELEADGTTTITTAQLPARGIAFAPAGESTYTVNLPTPDIRQSGLTFSLKTEYEEGSGTVFVTVVHAAVNLLTSRELDEDEGSIDFVWDGYAWTYSNAYLLRSFPNRVLQLPAGSGTLALTSDITKTYATFTATDNQPTASAFARLDTRNSIAVLDFTDTSTESAVFVGILPEAASPGSVLIVSLRWMATTATSGDVRWSVAWEKSNTDLDSDSFDTATAANATTNGTSGIVTVTNITCTSIDSLAAGDLFRLRVQRIGGDNDDTMTGDAELVAVEIRSAA